MLQVLDQETKMAVIPLDTASKMDRKAKETLVSLKKLDGKWEMSGSS